MADTKVIDETERTAPDGTHWIRSVDATGTLGSDRRSKEATWANFMPHVWNYRLSPVSDNSYYNPQDRTPTSTDTGADTMDFSPDHEWATGTMVHTSATVGGLTMGTTYYVRAVDSNTISLHPTFADASANTNKINLTATVTAKFYVFGITFDTIYMVPISGNVARPYNGTSWYFDQPGEMSYALTGLTASRGYDLFYNHNSGTPILSPSAAWNADGITRTDALTAQNGVLVKSGAATQILLGSFWALSATTGLLTRKFVGLSNIYNQRFFKIGFRGNGSAYTYTGSPRAINNDAATYRIDVLACNDLPVTIHVRHDFKVTATGEGPIVGLGFDDSTKYIAEISADSTADSAVFGSAYVNITTALTLAGYLAGSKAHITPFGRHTYYGMEEAFGTAVDFYPQSFTMVGFILC